MKFIEMFSDGEYVSWTRVIGTPIALCALFTFIYSIYNRYDDGLMYSVGLISLVLGAKSYQNHTEAKIQEKITSEINVLTEEDK